MNDMVTCSLCRRGESIYYRPYSGEYLCRSCFTRTVVARVRGTIARYRMFEYNSRIVLGVSGGKDSLGLLGILSGIEESFPKAELMAVTIDEGIGGYREEGLQLARKHCADWGVEHVVRSFKDLYGWALDEIVRETSEEGLTPCSYCGVLRRRALNETARQLGADRLATAHNLDDMAQTGLLNILRGDHRRLKLLAPKSERLDDLYVTRVKPYCEVPEKESALFAFLNGVAFQTIVCPYALGSMRNDARGFLDKMEVARPGTKYSVFRTLQRMREIETGEKLLRGICEKCGEPTSGRICRACELVDSIALRHRSY